MEKKGGGGKPLFAIKEDNISITAIGYFAVFEKNYLIGARSLF